MSKVRILKEFNKTIKFCRTCGIRFETFFSGVYNCREHFKISYPRTTATRLKEGRFEEYLDYVYKTGAFTI